MNVAVCVKQIPDPATPGSLDPATHTLVREGKLILDDSDAYGVEMALRLVEAAGGGEVVAVEWLGHGSLPWIVWPKISMRAGSGSIAAKQVRKGKAASLPAMADTDQGKPA